MSELSHFSKDGSNYRRAEFSLIGNARSQPINWEKKAKAFQEKVNTKLKWDFQLGQSINK